MQYTTIIASLPLHDGWHDGGMHDGGWWLWGTLMMAIWVALIVAVVVLIARRYEPHRTRPGDHAREILSERYARGEISTDEYHERLQALR